MYERKRSKWGSILREENQKQGERESSEGKEGKKGEGTGKELTPHFYYTSHSNKYSSSVQITHICPYLIRAGIKGLCHHTKLSIFFSKWMSQFLLYDLVPLSFQYVSCCDHHTSPTLQRVSAGLGHYTPAFWSLKIVVLISTKFSLDLEW